MPEMKQVSKAKTCQKCDDVCVGDTNMCLCHLLQEMVHIGPNIKVKQAKNKGVKLEVSKKKSDKPIKNTKKEKEKEPQVKIKRNKSAYIYFCMEHRQRIMEEYPDLHQKQVTTMMGELWSKKKQTPAQIQKYVELAKQDKIRYEQQVLGITPKSPPPAEPKQNQQGRKRDADEASVLDESTEEETILDMDMDEL
tara:strand:- start:2056 stop:2637 length:582 start_codon:yes stop_codon:yes gene_type:complete